MNTERVVLEFDEIHQIVEASIQKAGGEMPADEESLKRTPEEDIIEDLLSLMILAYERGNRDANEQLDTAVPVDLERMDEAIYSRIGGQTFADRAKTHIENNDPGRLVDLAESEYHRIYNTGSFDTAEETGSPVMKQWVTMLDPRVRPTHDFLEGVKVPLEDWFYTFDGDSARYPGDFDLAENNVNCRCILRYTYE